MTELNCNRPIPCCIWPVRVLACLTANRITVIAYPDQGLTDGGVPMEVESSLIPLELRMPNSEFLLLMKEDASEIVKVLRIGDEVDDARFVVTNAWR